MYKKLQDGTQFRDDKDLLMELEEEFAALGDQEKAEYCHKGWKDVRDQFKATDAAMGRILNTLDEFTSPVRAG